MDLLEASPATKTEREPAAPRVWALLGKRPGDNQQIETLAAASGLPWTSKRLRFRKIFEALPNLRRGGSLFSLSPAIAAELAAGPLPDVVIAAGKRSASAALWLKAASVGRTRLIHLGRTFAPPGWFDLVITTPQYRMARRPSVVENVLPLTASDQHAPSSSTGDVAALPRPRLLVIAGGDASPLVFGPDAARRLAQEGLARARSSGGSLLVATSPRTSTRAVAALRETLADADAPVRLSAFGEGPNEYHAFRAAADALLVTSDSVSMIAEAAITGAPVSVFALAERFDPRVAAMRFLEWSCSANRTAEAAFQALIDRGLVTLPRDVGRYLDHLARERLLEGGDAARVLAAAELADAAARVRGLAEAAAATASQADATWAVSSSRAPACKARGWRPAPAARWRPDAGSGRSSGRP